MKKKQLVFVPLGGCGEIGMNLSLYGYNDHWVVIDCGITFGDERYPGINIITPDISFIEKEIKNLHGIIITHGHEDHIGGVPHLWKNLNCPIYVTPFAAAHLRRKLSEVGLIECVPIREIPCGGGGKAGPFEFKYISVAHSIPETQAVSLKTPVGTLLHMTDWKLDPRPLVGSQTDEQKLRDLGDTSLIALMCDSTNAEIAGHSKSEGKLRDNLTKIISACSKRVVVACFASNIARLLTCVYAAKNSGRSVGLVGRSLWSMAENARSCGYLKEVPEFLVPEELSYCPRERSLIVATGSQGESRAALSRIASNNHSDIFLEKGDTVIFSSKEIPGNERAIGRLKNQLSARGVEILTEKESFVHVSGHPAQDELSCIYDWLKPKLLVPIHGETRHLRTHVKFAKNNNVSDALMVENGSVLRIYPGPAEIVGEVKTGRKAVFGRELIPVESTIIKTRRQMALSGMAVVTISMDGNGNIVNEPLISLPGLQEIKRDKEDDLLSILIEEVMYDVNNLRQGSRQNNKIVEKTAGRTIRRVLKEERGVRPIIQIHLVRI